MKGPVASKSQIGAPFGVRRVGVDALAAEVASPACEAEHTPGWFHGFYRTDAWPEGEVVLTFDDGPHPSITPKVLDLLAERSMPATFFLVGRVITRKTFHLVQRMVAEGHELGSHTYNHDIEMAMRQRGERTIEYIRGQHEVTRILIELALLAGSADEFDELYMRVFDTDPARYLPSTSLRTQWPAYVENHARILTERGFASDERPYELVYSRPPGGGPYVGAGFSSRRLNDEALRRAGLLNVMWHGGSGDVHPEHKRDFGFLTGNIRRLSRSGGVLLIHDYIRRDALASALDRIAADPNVRVTTLGGAVERKFHCSPAEMRRFLASLS